MWHSEGIQDIFHLFFYTFEFCIDAFKVLVAESALLRWNHESFALMKELHYSQLCRLMPVSLLPENAIRIHQNKQKSLKIYFLLRTIETVAGRVQRSLQRMHKCKCGNWARVKYVCIFCLMPTFWKFLINSENKPPFPSHRRRVQMKDVSIVFLLVDVYFVISPSWNGCLFLQHSYLYSLCTLYR